MIKFACTILYVKDVQKTINFYENAFGFTMKFTTPKRNYAELTLDRITLAFASVELANYNRENNFAISNILENPLGIELMFNTDNLEKLMEKAKSEGAIEEEKVTIKPWGYKVGYLRDNNGFLIQIRSSF